MKYHSDNYMIGGPRCALFISLLPLPSHYFWPAVEQTHATEPEVVLQLGLQRVLSSARSAGRSVWGLAPLSVRVRAQPRALLQRRIRSIWESLFGITRRRALLANTLQRRADMQLHHPIVLCVVTTSCRPGRPRGRIQSLQLQLRPMRRRRPRQVLTRPSRTSATRQPCCLMTR